MRVQYKTVAFSEINLDSVHEQRARRTRANETGTWSGSVCMHLFVMRLTLPL